MPQADISEFSAEARLDCDVCIIGSGPAGATIARELSNSRLKVTLLESGGFERQAGADALNEIENIGWPRIMDQWLVRNRIIGGSSHTWSGRCVPFDEIDFEARGWVPYSGWPFGLGHLTPYLDRAVPYLGLSIGTGFSDERFWGIAQRKPPKPEVGAGPLESFFWQFSRDETGYSDHTRFGYNLTAKLGDNVTLISNATVVQINVNTNGAAAESVEIAAPDGTRKVVAARIVILCAGGIENARLLLSSNRVIAPGVGNQNDQVGRYLMDHLRGPVGAFQIKDTDKFQQRFGHYRMKNGQVFAHGLRLTTAVQREEGLLNSSAWLEGAITAGDPWDALKRLRRRQGGMRQDSIDVLSNFSLLGKGLRDYFIGRQGLLRKIDRLSLVCMSEQLPCPDSRVTLSERLDHLGQPLSRIDWRVNVLEQRTMRRMAELAAATFTRMGYKPPVLEPWVKENANFPSRFQDVAHPTGTTRMGVEPANSVVDANCQVHGTHGLYIAGSSVFPTSSHANPTQMIVALSLRLADVIKQLH